MTLADDEIEAIQHLPRDTPYLIAYVRQTQFSIARFAGGCTFNGWRYTYDPTDDTLIRDDVLRLVTKRRKAAERAARKAEREAVQMERGRLL